MHYTMMCWLKGIRREHPALFHGRRVLECGANSEARNGQMFFGGCDYTGLDSRPGRGVDVVGLVHEYRPAQRFEVVVCLQMLEHDPHWRESLARMVDLLEPGGALILTWAGPGYPVHDLDHSPEPGYYRPLAVEEVLDALGVDQFARVRAYELDFDRYLLATGRQNGAGP